MALFLNKAEAVYDLVSQVESNEINAETVLLGDSVCRQFFKENKNSSVYCLCENQSYEIPGNYLLLDNLLKNESEIENVILVINPISIMSSLNQGYTYNYFVKPFRDLLNGLEEEDYRYIQKTFPKRDVLKYKFSDFELPNAFNIGEVGHIDSLRVSQINLKYLRKIDSLCTANKINFKMVSPPLPINKKEQLEKVTQETKVLLDDYLRSIQYYDSKDSKDGLHHSNPERYIEKNDKAMKALLKI